MNDKLKTSTRLFLIVAAAALSIVLFKPIWRIELNAPQYPEGLALTIHAKGLQGNVDIINGLNHYIGMKALHNEDFFEFTILPYCIIFFMAAFVVAALLNKRKWLNILFLLFLAFGIIAMIDFWRWEYDYGHNLNPDAAIIVPGMAYQPPLIGFKQLLNFGAYSVPDIGGWIFVGAGLVLLFCVVSEWKKNKSRSVANKLKPSLIAFLFIIGFASCNAGPEAIKIGTDQCSYCKMTISDARFGGEIITPKGRIYKFDDAHCLLSYLKSNEMKPAGNAEVYLSDFCITHQLIKVNQSQLLKSENLHSPMGGNIAAFQNTDSLKKMQNQFAGTTVSWKELSE